MASGSAALLALAGCGHEAPSPPSPAAAVSVAAREVAGEVDAGEVDAGHVDAGAPVEPDAGSAPAGMVTLPAGYFLMGSPVEHGSPEERPMHEVAVAAFDLDDTEVTARAYVACITAGACPQTHDDGHFCNAQRVTEGDRGEHPINCVDARAADAYCAFAGKRLPTEREWEYAARGGAEERRYSWGEAEPNSENACYFHIGTCKVGSFAAGAFGLHDMSGNVWEWTSTWFGPYPDEARSGTHRVYRGGSWSRRFPKWLSTAMRNRYEPEQWSASIGMRCARSRSPLVCPPDSEARDGGCARTRGTPQCEPTLAWNGDSCTPGGGPTPKPGISLPAAGPAPEEPITRTRTPEHDGDCHAHYAGKPAAYRYSGATFHARNKPLEAAGCTRRDMGSTWTSVCCPQ